MYSNFSPSEIYKRLLNQTKVYAVGTLLLKGGYLLILPLYWQFLTPTEFGIIGITQVITLFLAPLLEIGFFGAVQRLYYTWQEPERKKYVSTMWITNVFVGFTICVLLSLIGPYVFQYIFKTVNFYPYLFITIWTSFFLNIGQVPLGLMRIREEVKPYLYYSAGQFFIQHAISLTLLLSLSNKTVAYLSGQLIGSFLMSLLFIAYQIREFRIYFSLKYLLEPFKYAYPGTLSSVFEGAASSLDRFFLDKHVELSQIGLFTNARQIAGSLNVVNYILKTAATPLLYRVATDRNDAPQIFGKISMLYMASMLVPTMLVALLSKEFITFLNNHEYLAVYSFIPIFALGFFIHSLGQIFGRGMDLAKKTKLQPLVPITGLIIGIISVSTLTPLYGATGAAWSYVLTMAGRNAVEISLAYYYYPRPLHIKKLIICLIIASLTFAIGFCLLDKEHFLVSFAVKSIFIALATALIALTVIGREKLTHYVRTLLKR